MTDEELAIIEHIITNKDTISLLANQRHDLITKKEDLAGFDIVIDAFGAWTPEELPKYSTSPNRLCDILSGTDTRLLVVGGAESLYVNPERTITVMDTPDLSDIFKPLASNMGKH